MATFDFKLSWTLNGFAVPVEKKEVTFLDPQHLALEATVGDLDLDAEVEMRLASFKASSDMKWFLKALELPSKWWHNHCGQLPLLREIRHIIRSQKTSKGSASRLPRESKSMVLIKVRERILFVQNISSHVALGLRGTPGATPGTLVDELGVLKWFSQELQKDVKYLQENPKKLEVQEDGLEEEGEQEAGVEAEPEDEHQLQVIEKCLKDLQGHPSCQHAWWMPSRQCFRVTNKHNKSSADFSAKGLKRKHLSEQALENQFDLALNRALEFLDAPGASD